MTVTINDAWLNAPTDLTLVHNDVHVWRIELDIPETELQNLSDILSADEIQRAERFYKEQHRQRFVVGRGILRIILGRYLNLEPQTLEFRYEPTGKPVLADTCGGNKLYFNLSHSQGLALCAVSSDRPLGVDLEYVTPISDVLSLAKQFFSPTEYAVMRSLPPNLKQQTFFRYWTCKEAYLKATGAGLAQLQQIEVNLSPGEPAKLNTASDWSLLEMQPVKNSAAAVAIEGSSLGLKCWEYSM
ncbi:MAG: 4'-phosphopantetheinyl transferase HetI [Cyanobacteria bacterium P01_A01_bin.45]